MKITHAVGRCLTCIECRAVVDVLEACAGATTDAEHRWINPDSYTCGECAETATATSLPDTAQVAA